MTGNTEKFNKLKPTIKLTIDNPNSHYESAFGPGIATLCHGIQDLGSLNAAAKSIHMAYSKAWRIVRDTESALGFKLLKRDGARGSSLTPEGEKILQVFDTLTSELETQSESLYQSLIKD